VAIIAPNLLGNICDWKTIREIADKYNLKVIEDSADTLGATIGDKKTGYYSDMSITSFYGSHIINCAGNGGALILNDIKVIEKAKLLRSWGRSSSLFDEKSEAIENRFNIDLDGIDYDAKFVFEEIGYNLEGSEIGAAFGLAQLDSLEQNIIDRQKNFEIQKIFFEKHSNFFENPVELVTASTAWLAFPILIKKTAPFKRKDLQIFLEKRDIQTRVVFTGNILRQPMMKGINYISSPRGFVNSDAVMERGVLLPVHHGLNDNMISRLHKTIDEFVKNFT
jgi:CDP-6-deoxy-D-xylo-4-hexulose-3-dehydrase